MNSIIDILIPTWNNPQYLNPCINSIYKTGVLESGMAKLIIINNGKQPCEEEFKGLKGVEVITCPDNLGWEGGLKKGLENSNSPFVCFQNDDTYLPKTSYRFYEHLLTPFIDRNVACVGPITTTAAGIQSTFHRLSPPIQVEVNWIIFFTAMVRREHLALVGGVDDTLPGGDDLDLCIRFKKAGLKTVINPDAFIIHHGFKTGERVKGTPDKTLGWNSIEMMERTNKALIQKHGFKSYFTTISSQSYSLPTSLPSDLEGDKIAALIKPEESVLELGCGYRKTVPQSIGVDLTPKGDKVPICHGHTQESVADIVADVSQPLPFNPSTFDVIIARHILEHCVDTISTLKHWTKVLKPGGKLIIAVPDEDIIRGIPLSADHCHAYNQTSLKALVELLGYKSTYSESTGNGISFIAAFEKAHNLELSFASSDGYSYAEGGTCSG